MPSLNFANTSGRYIEAAASSSINNLTAFTIYCWINFTTLTGTGKRIWSKQAYEMQTDFGDATDIGGQVDRVTTVADWVADTNLSTATWYFLAHTYDESDGPRLFVGTLAAPATEASYTTRNVGSGATSSSTSVFRVGTGWNFTTNQLDAKVAVMGIRNERLTVGQIQAIQYRPLLAGASVKLTWWLGFNGLTNVPDLSGNANTGSVNGTPVLADGVPLPPQFGFDLGWQGAATAAAAGGGRKKHILRLGTRYGMRTGT